MRALTTTVGTFISSLAAGPRRGLLVAGAGRSPGFRRRRRTVAQTSTSQLRTTLYFGLARPKGSVSELEWQIFLRDEVTGRFPEGLRCGGRRASGGRPPAASITSSRRSCSSSTPIRRRRGNRSRPSSRRIARPSSSNPFSGKAPASASRRERREHADPAGDRSRVTFRVTSRWQNPNQVVNPTLCQITRHE